MRSLDSICAKIVATYGSLNEPSFGFVQAALDADPYRELVATVRAIFELSEDTDANDDVSFGFVLRTTDGIRILRLSMIGPYAVLLRPVGDDLFQAIDRLCPVSQDEGRLLDLLRRFDVEPLDQSTLSAPIPVELTNVTAERCCVYQALFTDTDILPWRC